MQIYQVVKKSLYPSGHACVHEDGFREGGKIYSVISTVKFRWYLRNYKSILSYQRKGARLVIETLICCFKIERGIIERKCFICRQTAINFSLLLLPEDIEMSALSRETICPAWQIFRILYFFILYLPGGIRNPLVQPSPLPSRPKMRTKIVTVILTELHEKCLPCTAQEKKGVYRRIQAW